jgi:hypothetical protein
MPIRMSEFKSLTGGVLIAALLGLPAIGCGGDDDDDDTNTGTPSLTQGTPTQAGNGTPTEPVSNPDQFPYGQYYYQFAYVLSFQSLPYIVTFAGYTWDAENVPTGKTNPSAEGNWEGQNIVVVWNTRAAYQAGEAADCKVYEDVIATDHASGTDSANDYASCEFCDPFADYFSDADLDDDDVADDQEGCEQEFIDAWYYYDDLGDYDYTFSQLQGYRHAATDGWPGDFADLVDSLEAAGYQGSIYDQLTDLISGGDGSGFAAGYYVKPVDLNAKLAAGPMSINTSASIEIQLKDLNDLREVLYRAKHR